MSTHILQGMKNGRVSESRTRNHALEVLDQIQALPENWDGEGAASFSLEHVTFVKKIIQMLPRVPLVVPTGRESINLEYSNGSQGYLEFEVFNDRHIERYRRWPNWETQEGIIAFEDLVTEVNAYEESIS